MLMAFGEILMNGGINNIKDLAHVNNTPPGTNTITSTENNSTQRRDMEAFSEPTSPEATVTMGEFETCTETLVQETPQQRIAELEKELYKLQANQPTQSGLDLKPIKM